MTNHATIIACCLGLVFATPAHAAPPDPHVPLALTCGPVIQSVEKLKEVRFDETFWLRDSTLIPYAGHNVIVPVGQKQCVKVHFSALTVCQGDYCQINALLDGKPMPGSSGDDQSPMFISHNYGNQSFEFAQYIGGGNHRIDIRLTTLGESGYGEVYLRRWTLEVETSRLLGANW